MGFYQLLILILIYICIFLVLVLDLIFSDILCFTTLVILILELVNFIIIYSRARRRTFFEASIIIAIIVIPAIDVGVCVRAEWRI